MGETHLFFGCQNESKHFMYRDEFEDAVMKKALSGLHTAFSRDQATKVYVQHRLRERKEDVWRVLQAGGHLYICGDAKYMAQDVRRPLLRFWSRWATRHSNKPCSFSRPWKRSIASSKTFGHNLLPKLYLASFVGCVPIHQIVVLVLVLCCLQATLIL